MNLKIRTSSLPLFETPSMISPPILIPTESLNEPSINDNKDTNEQISTQVSFRSNFSFFFLINLF
jgi:hypothetical protein